MFRRLTTIWLPRMLYRLALLCALALSLLVVIAPYVAPPEETVGGSRLLILFAHNSAVRRTALACAVGLTVTASIFFRPPPALRLPRPRGGPKTPPPPTMAGA